MFSHAVCLKTVPSKSIKDKRNRFVIISRVLVRRWKECFEEVLKEEQWKVTYDESPFLL